MKGGKCGWYKTEGMSIIIRLHKYFSGFNVEVDQASDREHFLWRYVFIFFFFPTMSTYRNKNDINRHKQRDMYVRKANGSISFVWEVFFFNLPTLCSSLIVCVDIFVRFFFIFLCRRSWAGDSWEWFSCKFSTWLYFLVNYTSTHANTLFCHSMRHLFDCQYFVLLHGIIQ